MDVHVGSAYDPKEGDHDGHQGLAHFLEHMLFLGSGKYKEEGSYGAYLALHGGYANAFTAQTHTNYYFTVQAEAFTEALDRFAQFFVDPLLSYEGMAREVKAVHSEHEKNVLSDAWREYQLVLSLAESDSAFHHFATGNRETLQPGERLHRALLSFYAAHYRNATRMKLCVVGPQSLDELQTLVQTRFQEIGGKNESTAPDTVLLTTHELSQIDPYPSDALPVRVYAQPVTVSMRALRVFFFIPIDLEQKYRLRIPNYLAYLHHSRDKGSLYHCLHELALVEDIDLTLYDSLPVGFLVRVSLQLTEQGEAKHEEVLKEYYRFLEVLQEATDKKGCELWKQSVALEWLHFNFEENQPGVEYAIQLATAMHYAAPEDVLGSPRNAHCHEHVLRSVLERLSPENAIEIAWFSSQNITGEETRTDPFYGTRYNVTRGGVGGKNKQNVVKEGSNHTQNLCPHLHVRQSNAFLTEYVLSENITLANKMQSSEKTNSPPEVVRSDMGNTVWYSPSKHYHTNPRMEYRCSLAHTGAVDATLVVAAGLHNRLLQDQLISLQTEATEVELSSDFDISSRGSSIRVAGFYDKTPALLDEMLRHGKYSAICDSITEQRFEIVRAKYLKDLDHVASLPAYMYAAKYVLPLLIDPHAYCVEEERRALEGFKHKEKLFSVLQVAQSLVRTHTDCLGFGNVDRNTTLAMTNHVGNLAEYERVASRTEVQKNSRRLLTLPSGADILVHTTAGLPEDENEVVLSLYELSSDPIVLAHARVFERFISPLCFEELRTKRQLGYIVQSTLRTTDLPQRSASFFMFLIQSPLHNATTVLESLEEFLRSSTVENLFEELSEEKLTHALEAVKGSLSEPPLTLKDETDRVWHEIVSEQFRFDRRDNDICDLDKVSVKSLQQFYMQLVDGGQRRRLSVVVTRYGAPNVTKWNTKCDVVDMYDIASNIDTWRNNMTFA